MITSTGTKQPCLILKIYIITNVGQGNLYYLIKGYVMSNHRPKTIDDGGKRNCFRCIDVPPHLITGSSVLKSF